MKNENKYWENEEGEVIKFGNSFMRYYEKAGKLQFGFVKMNGDLIVKNAIDRSELSKSKEGLPYLREVLEEWQEWADEMMIEFFIPMKLPTVTHQQKKVHVVNGKPHYYEPDALKDARLKFSAHLAAYVPEKKLTGPIRLLTKWCYTAIGKHKNGEYKITKPDTDNMIKLLKDVMTGLGYWTDDAQVASEITEKFWSEQPGLYVRIEQLE